MRVAMIDAWGTALSWGIRLQAEGCDVQLYAETTECPNGDVGKNLVQQEPSYERLVAWAKEAPEETIVLFCQSKYGEKADALRKDGLYVVGGGAFADKLEDDRQFGQDVAEAAGMAIPKFQAFTSLSDGISHFSGSREGGVFKSDTYLESDATQVCATGEALVEYLRHLRERFGDRVKFIVQELIGGRESADFDINRWWNGEAFVGPYGLTMEKKRFLAGDLGPSTGCAINALWYEEDSAFAREVNFDRLAEIYAGSEAPPGIYAYNFRISDDDGKAYYLETTPRLGFDSEPTAALLVDSLSDFLWAVGTRQGGTHMSSALAFSARLSVPPYPHETVDAGDKNTAKGVPLPHDMGDLYSPPFVAYQIALEPGEGLYVASPEGIVGLAAAVGDDFESMGEEVLDFVTDLHKQVSKLQVRIDGVKAIQGDAAKLEALGIDVHPAILRGAKEEREAV